MNEHTWRRIAVACAGAALAGLVAVVALLSRKPAATPPPGAAAPIAAEATAQPALARRLQVSQALFQDSRTGLPAGQLAAAAAEPVGAEVGADELTRRVLIQARLEAARRSSPEEMEQARFEAARKLDADRAQQARLEALRRRSAEQTQQAQECCAAIRSLASSPDIANREGYESAAATCGRIGAPILRLAIIRDQLQGNAPPACR